MRNEEYCSLKAFAELLINSYFLTPHSSFFERLVLPQFVDEPVFT